MPRIGVLVLLRSAWQAGAVGAGRYGHNAHEWAAARKGIYQAITDRFAPTAPVLNNSCDCARMDYCGGTFRGMMENLDHIQSMGFDSVWISPVVENTPMGYHGYWAKDFYGINEHFGTAEELLELVRSFHARGMWWMLDIVINHVAPVIDREGVGADQINPFSKPEHYHPYCLLEDFTDDFQLHNCRLAGLPDLNQERDDVADMLLEWIEYMVSTYGIDGLRLDTGRHVRIPYWKRFTERAGMYSIGEVDDDTVEVNAPYITSGSMDATVNYPLFWVMRHVLLNQYDFASTVRKLVEDQKVNGLTADQLSWTGNFVDNHDNPRFLSVEGATINKFRTAMAFTVLWPGIPIFYQGQEFAFSGGDDPYNREILWPFLGSGGEKPLADLRGFVGTLMAVRGQLLDAGASAVEPEERYATNDFYCFSRAGILGCFTNSVGNVHYVLDNHPFKVGETVCNVFWKTDCVTVGSDNTLQIFLDNGEPKIFTSQQASSGSAGESIVLT